MTPSQATPLTSAAAVRLARFAYPGEAFTPLDEEWPWEAVSTNDCLHFSTHTLDDLALAEQRVVAAGLGCELTGRALAFVPIPEGHRWTLEGSLLAAYTATAEQRARALISLLDSHPELESGYNDGGREGQQPSATPNT